MTIVFFATTLAARRAVTETVEYRRASPTLFREQHEQNGARSFLRSRRQMQHDATISSGRCILGEKERAAVQPGHKVEEPGCKRQKLLLFATFQSGRNRIAGKLLRPALLETRPAPLGFVETEPHHGVHARPTPKFKCKSGNSGCADFELIGETSILRGRK